MPKITRKVGTTNEVLDIFVSDATNSSGAGLINVQGTSVNFSWWHNDQVGVSTGVGLSTGSMGVYTSAAWTQISSTQAAGWYQFGAPNGVFASGRSAAIHFYGATNMAPVPLEIELSQTDNQTAMSSQAVSTVVDARFANLDGSVSSRVASSDSRLVGIAASSDSRFALLDASVSSRVASSDSRLAFLDVSVSSRVASSDSRLVAIASSTDSRFAFLDVSVSSRAASSDSRLTLLDISVSSRVASSDSRIGSLTAAERATLAGVILTTTQPEGFRASSAAMNLVQFQYEVMANLCEFANSGTTRVVNSVTSHAGALLLYQYDSSSAPAAITRIA